MRNLFLIVSLLMCFVPSLATAAKMDVVNHIPERYALLVLSEVEPDQPLDEAKILSIAKERMEELGVAQLQFCIYDKDKKSGDGVRAFGEMFKGEWKHVPFTELTGDKAQVRGKMVESSLGYVTTPQELYGAYSDNEVAADDDFKGKVVCMKIEVPQVSKDALGRPYMKIHLDKTGLAGVQIYLAKEDPFLRKIKKGSKVVVRASAKGFVMDSVQMDGIILKDEDSFLFDGKVVSKDAFAIDGQ